MFKDCRGLSLTTVSEQAVARFDHAVDGYLGYPRRYGRPDGGAAGRYGVRLAHCLRGYLFMMSFRADSLAAARAALAEARRCAGTPRETGACRRAGALDRRRPGTRGSGVGPHPGRASA